MSCSRSLWRPQAITAYVTLKADALGFPGYQKRISRVGVHIPSNVAHSIPPLGITTLLDLDTVGTTRSVEMNTNEEWKMYRLDPEATNSRSGSVVQVKVTYIGVPAIDVKQVQIGFQVIGRRARFK